MSQQQLSAAPGSGPNPPPSATLEDKIGPPHYLLQYASDPTQPAPLPLLHHQQSQLSLASPQPPPPGLLTPHGLPGTTPASGAGLQQQVQHSAMLLEGTSPDLMSAQSKLLFQINKYYNERVHARKANINKTIRDVCKVVQDVLKEVEVQEPRFIRLVLVLYKQ